MWDSIKPTRRQFIAIASAFAVSVAAASVSADTTSTWTGLSSSVWSNAANWSPNALNPNNGNGGVNYNVIIGAPSPAVLDITVTIDALTVNAGANLQTDGGTTLNLNGPTLVDNGTITININEANAQTGLSFLANTTVSGTGTIVLTDNGNPNAARLDTALNVVLTQAAGHTISGHGEINAALVNNGTVNANAAAGTPVLNLQTNGMTNNNLFEATSTGTLNVSGITVTQGATGTTTAVGSTAIVDIANSTIVGGTLTTSGGGVIQVVGTSAITSLTNSGLINLLGGQNLTANGDIVDTGTITVNSNTANAQTIFSFAGGTVSGTGTIVLTDSGNTNAARLDGTLTQASGHSITGHGVINAALTNNGVVNANTNAGSAELLLQTSNMTNNSTFEATGNGTLNISSIPVTQGAAGTITAVGATAVVDISASTIVNGTLASTGGGVIQVIGSSAITSLTNTALVNIIGGQSLTANGNIADNGTITVNSNAGNAQTILSFAGGNLTGSGTIVLNDNTNGNNARLDGDLTQAATHSITGHGNLNANLTNNGLVNANVTGTTLNIRGVTVTNTVTLEATNGGVLAINNGTAVNNTGGQINANGGNVSISGSVSITGGTLNSSAGNAIDLSTVSLTGVTIGAGTNVFIDPGTGTAFLGTGLTDNGTITVNPSAGNAGTQFLVASNLTVSGSGAILLNDNGNSNNARLDTGANITLTQAAGHTIAGHGAINASLINNGTVNANTATDVLVLQTSNMTNNGLFEATAGILNITGITISQGSTGQIAASPGTVNLNAATISNGTLNGAGIFEVVGTSTINSLTTHAAIHITAGQSLIANGNIVSNNTITVNDNQANAGTSINFTGGTLSGTSVIVLNDNGNSNNARIDGSFTQSSGEIIQGHGAINAALTNNGTVNANTATDVLVLQTSNMTNNGLFEATAGILNITGITISQGSTGQIAASPGTVNLNAATISNGTLNGAGIFEVVGTSTINSLTTHAAIQITAGQSLIANGNIVSNNTITVNDNQANAGTSINFGGATVSGTGVIFLNDNSNPNNARVDGTLTLGANQIITGHGNVNAVITNNGTILSNVTNAIININGQLNNAGLVRATNGGVINIAATAILANGTVGSGTLQVDANSSMTINSLSTNAGTILLNSATSSLTGLTSITNAGNITLTGGTATTLTLSGSLTGASNGQLNGNGTLIAGSLFGNLSTVAGVVRVKINGATTGTSKLTTLAIAGGTNAWTGDLDLTNNKVIVEDSTQHANTLATLENQVLYGRTHGAGITSSDLPAHAIVAVIDNAALPTPFSTFGGQVVDLNSILVAPELPGDADFSGKVDLTDLNTVLNHLGVADSHWTSGNFDGAATIDLTDLNDVLNNLGVSLPNANSIASPAAATPEPASLAIMGAGVSLLLRRRRC